MAASVKTIIPEKSDPSEDWTVVLPRRGKKDENINVVELVILERRKEVQSWAPVDLETDPEKENRN